MLGGWALWLWQTCEVAIWENTLGKCPFEKCLWESIHTIDFSYPKVSITSLLSRYPKVRITTVLSRYRKVSITTAFSLIFVPESNLHELDLVADDQVKKQGNPPPWMGGKHPWKKTKPPPLMGTSPSPLMKCTLYTPLPKWVEPLPFN